MRIGLHGFHQQPFLEYVNNEWRIYVAFNKDVTGGTYLVLGNKGICDRVTFVDNEIMNIDRITQ